MKRQEYVVKLLTAIQEDRPLAKGLLLLVQGGSMDDAMIDALSKIFIDAVDKTTMKINENKVRKGAQILQKIRTMEEGENNKELEDLESLIDEL